MAEKLYRVNWQISGLTKKDLFEGDEVSLSDEVAASLGGAVTEKSVFVKASKPAEPAPGEPASAVQADSTEVLPQATAE